MTFIKSEKRNTLLFMMLALPLILAILGLIVLYNQTVNLKHGITDLKTNVQQIGGDTAVLKDHFFSIFDPQKVVSLAKAQGLVKEAKPSYLEVNSWVLASHL